MADVTSTARLVVTVEGEGKIAALAAQLRALKAAGGTTKLGTGGAAGLAQQAAATRRLQGAVARQGAATTKALSTVTRAQAVTGRLLAPMAAQQRTTAKLMAPMVAQQAKVAKVVSQLAPATAAVAKAQQQWMRLRSLQQAGARTPSQAGTVPTGMTPGLIKSIQKRNAGWTAQQIAANIANPPPLPPPPPPRGRAARRAAAAAAGGGLAQPPTRPPRGPTGPRIPPRGPARFAHGAGADLLGTVPGATLVTGGIARMAGTMAAAAAAVVGFKSIMTAANKQADEFVDTMGAASRAGLTVDELQQRRTVGEAVFGDKYESAEAQFAKLFGPKKEKAGIAGQKGVLQRLGLDEKNIAKGMEGKPDPLGVVEKLAGKREELEAKLAAAKTPKSQKAAQAVLDRFWKDVSLLGPGYVRGAGFNKATARKMRQDQAQTEKAFDLGIPQKELKDRAERNVAARTGTQGILQQFQQRVGQQVQPAQTGMFEALNQKLREIGPAAADVAARIGEIGFKGITDALTGLDSGKITTALNDAKKAMEGFELKDLTVEKLQGGFNKVMDTALKGLVDNFSGEGIREFISKDFNEKFLPSFKENIKTLGEKMSTGFNTIWDNIKKGLTEPPKEGEEQAFGGKSAFGAFGDWLGGQIKGILDQAKKAAGLTPEETPEAKAAREAKEEEDRRKEKEKIVPPPPILDVPQATINAPGATIEEAPSIVPKLPEGPTPATPPLEGQLGIGDIGTNLSQKAGDAAQIFNDAAGSGLSGKGSEAGGAFSGAVDASSIGNTIGSTAAGIISAATVNVKVDVSGAAGAAVGGSRGSPPSTGHNSTSANSGP